MPEVAIPHGGEAPSPWVRRWAHLVPPGATVLDLACGAGRHIRFFAARGGRVTGVDRDAAAVAPLRALGEIVVADLEDGPWPLDGRRFDAVVVANYLWRPRIAELLATVVPGGFLIHETFAQGHERIGRPSRPDFLLEPGELLRITAGWRTVAYEDGFEPAVDGPGRVVQRIVAQRPPADGPVALGRPPPGGDVPAAG